MLDSGNTQEKATSDILAVITFHKFESLAGSLIFISQIALVQNFLNSTSVAGSESRVSSITGMALIPCFMRSFNALIRATGESEKSAWSFSNRICCSVVKKEIIGELAPVL